MLRTCALLLALSFAFAPPAAAAAEAAPEAGAGSHFLPCVVVDPLDPIGGTRIRWRCWSPLP